MIVDEIVPDGDSIASTRERLGNDLPNGSHALARGARLGATRDRWRRLRP